MLERSELATNVINCLHAEQDDGPFNIQNIEYTNKLFMGNRITESLNNNSFITLRAFLLGFSMTSVLSAPKYIPIRLKS